MSAARGEGRLPGLAVFLSASVPDPRREREYRVENEPNTVYERVPDAHVEIEQAVVALTRAVFSAGGRLVFGGHPAISPLVALVAGEYRAPVPAEEVREGSAGSGSSEERQKRDEPLVLIYQSRAYEAVVPKETWLLHRLGYAQIRWTPAVNDERFNPELSGQPQCENSLELMRRTMVADTDPVAMVCIGGMKGIRDELRIFWELYPDRRVYVLESTGGAARWLAQREEGVDPIDLRILEQLRSQHRLDGSDLVGNEHRFRSEDQPYSYTPFPLIMQTLVDELVLDRDGRME